MQILIQCPLSEFNNVKKNHYWVYGIVLKNGANREKVTDELSLRGIQTRPFFWPLHLQNSLPVEFKKYQKINYPMQSLHY